MEQGAWGLNSSRKAMPMYVCLSGVLGLGGWMGNGLPALKGTSCFIHLLISNVPTWTHRNACLNEYPKAFWLGHLRVRVPGLECHSNNSIRGSWERSPIVPVGKALWSGESSLPPLPKNSPGVEFAFCSPSSCARTPRWVSSGGFETSPTLRMSTVSLWTRKSAV